MFLIWLSTVRRALPGSHLFIHLYRNGLSACPKLNGTILPCSSHMEGVHRPHADAVNLPSHCYLDAFLGSLLGVIQVLSLHSSRQLGTTVAETRASHEELPQLQLR